MEQFVLNKMLITPEEQQEILSALLSMKETNATEEKEILQKLGNFFRTEPMNWISIDFSDWGDGQKQLFEDIKKAILTQKVISFDYYGQNRAMSRRTVEPIQLLFKEYTWYLRAYCRERNAFRTFKLTRIREMEVLEENCKPKEVRLEEKTDSEKEQDIKTSNVFAPLITLWIDKKEAYRVYDRFAESNIEILEDGNFLVRVAYPLDEWVYGLILSFGSSAKVLEPLEIQQEIKKRISDMMKNYAED